MADTATVLPTDASTLAASQEEEDVHFAQLLRALAATPQPVQRQLLAGARLGPYEIVELLGSGGMGEVYKAEDHRLRRAVAIKLLFNATAVPARLSRFTQEARVLATLSHPAIPAVFDVGVHEGVPYLVMELCPGDTLRVRLGGGALPLAESLRITLRIAEGLAAAHTRGVVHRDLKPENIILCGEQVRILDFGLAKLVGEEGLGESVAHSTQTGAVLGTARYMSPEQVRGQPIDQRSDLFSLGVMLYEMLEGRPPFSGASLVEIMAAILREDAPALTRPLPAALAAVLARCLERSPDERYADARELAARLQALPAGEGADQPAERQVRELPCPETRYAKSAGVHLAYQVFGEGPVDLVFVPGFVSQVEHWWEQPEGRRFFSRLGSFARVVLFDKRGTGLSDRVPDRELPSLEQRMDDIRAVMDAAQVRRAVIFGVSEGGPMAVKFALVHPERTRALVLYGTAPEFQTTMMLDALRGVIREHWGRGLSMPLIAPSRLGDKRLEGWVARWERLSASPGAALAIIEMLAQVDIRPLLPQVAVPTLVLHRSHDALVRADGGRALAAGIKGARYIEYPGADHAPLVGGAQALLDDVAAFVQQLQPPPADAG